METEGRKEEILDRLMRRQREATKFYDWRVLEAIWLREKLGLSGKEVAAALGYRVQTVHWIWHRWKQDEGAFLEDRRGPGGRNHSYLSEEEEKEFLAPFFEEAERGGIVTAREIKRAYEKEVGHSVAKSTIYRLLHRHGWRKVAPRKRHPKADPEVQARVKKT